MLENPTCIAHIKQYLPSGEGGGGYPKKYSGKYYASRRRMDADFHVGTPGLLPYKGLLGTCGQSGYVFRDFRLKQGINFLLVCLKQGIFFWQIS